MRSQKKPGATRKSPDKRNAQLVRALKVIRDLDRSGGEDLYELARRYGTTVRTIRRDLDALQAAGLPLVEEEDPGGGRKKKWRIAFHDALTQLTGLLDASHYLGLAVAMRQCGPVRGVTGLFTPLEDLAAKIEEALGEKGRGQLEAIERCFHSYEKFAYTKSPPDMFWPLVNAITEQRVCRVTYRAPRPKLEDKTYEVLPLRLFCYQGAVYLWCNILKHNELTPLNLHRLQDLQVLDQRAEVPEGFDPERIEAAAWGVFTGGALTTYRLRFAAGAAPYIRERIWHASQKMRDLRGGRVELTFTCQESPDLTAWIASWRDLVEVLEPASLRAELGSLGEWLQKKYLPAKRRTLHSPPRTRQ